MGARILWFLFLSLLKVYPQGVTAPWVPSGLTLRAAIMCRLMALFTDTPGNIFSLTQPLSLSFLLYLLLSWVASVVSDTVRPHRQQPTRLRRPWDSPGKNTGVGCHFLLQCMKVESEREVAQSCPTLSDPMDCSLPGSSIHRIFQARVLEWGVIAFSVLLYRMWIRGAPSSWGWGGGQMGHTCEYLEKGRSQWASVTVCKCPVSEGVTNSYTRLQSLGVFQTAVWLILQVTVPFPRRKKIITCSILFTKFQNIILSELYILFFNLPNKPRR